GQVSYLRASRWDSGARDICARGCRSSNRCCLLRPRLLLARFAGGVARIALRLAFGFQGDLASALLGGVLFPRGCRTFFLLHARDFRCLALFGLALGLRKLVGCSLSRPRFAIGSESHTGRLAFGLSLLIGARQRPHPFELIGFGLGAGVSPLLETRLFKT